MEGQTPPVDRRSDLTAIEADSTAPDGELGSVLRWRFEELRRAGYEECDALELACHSAVDLHVAAGLLERGCRSATAVRIAA